MIKRLLKDESACDVSLSGSWGWGVVELLGTPPYLAFSNFRPCIDVLNPVLRVSQDKYLIC